MNIPKPSQNILAKTVKLINFSLLEPGDKLFLTTERSRYTITVKTSQSAVLESTNETATTGDIRIVGGMNQCEGSGPLNFIGEGQHFVYSPETNATCGIKTTPILGIKIIKAVSAVQRLAIPRPVMQKISTDIQYDTARAIGIEPPKVVAAMPKIPTPPPRLLIPRPTPKG